jgi:hypothetical protein
MPQVKIYPSDAAYQYYANGSYTNLLPYARAGQSGTTTYYWPMPFNLSAHSDKMITKITLYVKVASSSDSFNQSHYLRAGRASNNTYSAAANATTLNTLYGVDTANAFNAWDVTGAAATLISGGYIVMSGNKYAELYSNHSNVAEGNRPYIIVEYEDKGMPRAKFAGTYRNVRDVYVRFAGAWRKPKDIYARFSGAWRKIK